MGAALPGALHTGPVMWRMDPLRLDPEIVDQAASLLARGGTVVYPTETLYALGAHPMDEGAVRRIYIVKGRDSRKPLPLIAADRSAVTRAVSDWPPDAEALARSFWPGPLTLILPAAVDLPSVLHAGTGRIALRISSHPVARALSAGAGGLVVSTSANLTGETPCRRVEEMSEDLFARVDGVVDAGGLPGGLPSTIVDVTCVPARLVRVGRLPWESIVKSIRASLE
jgi:L-threonylcarbamoyladenylate synthase